MLPESIALVDDDSEFSEFLSEFLRQRGVDVIVYKDGAELLTDDRAYSHHFYVMDLGLPGIDGLELIKVLRRRTNVGVLVVSGRLDQDVFRQVVTAGADMYLAKPVQFEQVAIAIEAVQRRAGSAHSASQASWTLDRRARQLITPDAHHVDLSDLDLLVMSCFVEAAGELVSRETLRTQLNLPLDQEGADGLNAIIYRLRRRVERVTPLVVPLQSKSRQGYVFKEPLIESN